MQSFSGVERVIADLLHQRGEMYGLDLVRRSDGRLRRGSIYVTLARMEDKGLVESRYEKPRAPGPQRRLYCLSSLGTLTLKGVRAAERVLRNGT